MGLYRYNNRETYFVHIPRTGGRHVDKIIKSSGAEHAYTNMDHMILGRFTCHLHYPLYELKLPTNNATHITVVRNPLERFKSMMKQKSKDFNVNYNEYLKTKSDWDRFLLVSQEIDDFKANWIRPQHQFICRKTLIWKFEDGFGENFTDWLHRMSGIEAEPMDRSYELLPSEKSDREAPELNDQICDWAKEFYLKDYERFGYKTS